MSKKFNIKPPTWPKEYTFIEFAKLNPHIINENQLVSLYNQYLNKYLTELGEKKIHFKQSKITQLLTELKESQLQSVIATATPSAGYQYTSRYSLAFDGLTNEVTTAFSGSSAATVDKTYSWWMKATETAQNAGVFGYGSTKREAFTLNASQNSMGKPKIALATHVYKFFMTPGHEEDGGGTSGNADGGADEATAHIEAQDDGLWHHWMLFIDASDAENAKLFIDGVEQETAKFANTGTNHTQDDSLTIGAVDSGTTTGEHFGGSLDEFSIFGGDKTSEASKYYNKGRPYDVTNEADLQGYWKFENNADDSSGNGYHGTLRGSPIPPTFSTSTPK